MTVKPQPAPKARTGVEGLDDILVGGLSPGHVYLLEGSPGTGKTTIALQFLLDGAKAGETGLYVTMSETEGELRDGAASHGWTLGDRVHVYELVPPENLLDDEHQQSLLYSSDLELGETTRAVFAAIGVILSAVYMLWMYQRAFLGRATPELSHHMPDMNGREWVAMLPLLVLMVWMGSFTQSFMPPISAQNTRILEMSKVGVDFQVQKQKSPAVETASAPKEMISAAR